MRRLSVNQASPIHRLTAFVTVLVTCVLLGAAGWAAELTVVGALRTSAGGPVADGGYGLIARLYDGKASKVAVYKAVFGKVEVKAGQFSLVLGAGAEKLPDALLTAGKPLWVSMQVVGDDELGRVPLTRVPGAWHATVADKARALGCDGCVATSHIAVGAVNASKVAFTWAGSTTKGGSANHALKADAAKVADIATSAQKAKTADNATVAQLALSAKVAEAAKAADKAKNADNASVAQVALTAKNSAALKCTGCVTTSHLDAATKAAFLSSAGGVVKGKLTVQGSLALGNSSINGGRFAAIDLAKTTCDLQALGRVSVSKANGKLYFCDGKGWRRLQFCSESCPKPSTAACGKSLFNGCGEACGAKGTHCAEGNCQNDVCVLSGKTRNSAVPDCKALLAQKPVPASGEFWVDPNGGSKDDAVKTWCEMSLFGGGWTLVAANSKSSKLLPTNGQGVALTATGLAGTPHPRKDYVIGPQMKALTFSTAMVWAETGDKRLALQHAAATYPYVSPGANTYKVVQDGFGAGVHKKLARYFTLGCEEKDAGNNANTNQNTTGICVVAGSSGDPSSGTYVGHGTSEGSYEGYYRADGTAVDVDHYSSWVR